MSVGKFIYKFWWLLLLVVGGGVAIWYFKFRKTETAPNNQETAEAEASSVETEEELTR